MKRSGFAALAPGVVLGGILVLFCLIPMVKGLK